MTQHADVAVVGAGHAGAAVAAQLRQQGFSGSVVVFGEEIDPPYDRPPLSKDYLRGDKAFERLLLRGETFWAERAIGLRLGRRVVGIDEVGRRLSLADGAEVTYGALVWAAGGIPRRLSCEGADLAGVHTLRTRADADALRGAMRTAERVVVVGGGYIGLEAAAVMRKLGKQVVVVEAQERLLARVTGTVISEAFAALHRAQGVEIRLACKVAAVGGRKGRATHVTLAGGEDLPADLVVVGVGILPATGPLRSAGALGEDGVDVDPYCRTSLSNVYAIGDAAAVIHPLSDGRRQRLESVQNANDTAAVAARAICGAPKPYDAPPWFWSDQYGVRLQTIGLAGGHDQAVVRGVPADGAFSVVYLREGRVAAIDCVNTPKDYLQGRGLVIAQAVVSADRLADVSTPLNAMLDGACAAAKESRT
jgi:3-phenylpropionate/trans-cinnamate dioxygenase ferredoxin reductase subunit